MRRTMLEEHERVTQSGHEETTVGSFREIWLADCADRLAPRTVHSYRRILQLEALTPLLPMELHEVTARKLAPIISRVTAEHGRRAAWPRSEASRRCSGWPSDGATSR
jgi:hypothetical protein